MSNYLHSDRYGSGGISPKHGVVIHDSEGSDNSAQLISFLKMPGDRPSPTRPGGKYGAGYHAVAKEDGTYEDLCNDTTATPYHAPPLNGTFWSICMPGKAAQTREEWLDTPSRSYIKAVAKYIVDKQVPQTYLSVQDLLANKDGYTSHNNVSYAWRKTNHTDPGPNFPWDILAQDIKDLTSPPPTTPPGINDTVIRILKSLSTPPEFYAEFVAVTDKDGHSIEVQWSGDGANPAVQKRWNDLKAAGIETQHITLAGLKNNRLHPKHKPSDIKDNLHVWKDEDFA